jgi:putative heme-binding domain-containing protein
MGFLEQQLRNPNDQEDAWGELQRKGFVSFPDNEKPMESERMVPMAGMQEKHASVDRRARSYLHSNCAHCHQFGGAGSAEFDIRFEKSIEETKCIDGRPIKGSFQIDHAKLISPGDPFRSMLYYRMAKSGSGRMPHIGSERVDTAGASLIRHWIQSMPQDPAQRKAMDTITSPSSNVSDDDRKNATIALLATQEGSQRIANALAEDAIPSFFISQVFAIANNAPESSREFIEPFLPASMRIARLGNTFDRSRILSGEGDSERGRALVLAGTAQCIQCHQVGDQGKAVGPKLEGLATKYKTKQEMLEHLLQPSKTIAPEYRSISVLTVDGESLIGRLVRRSTAQLTLMLADGSQRELDLEEIEFEKENELSLMPSGLLSTLTEQQARDLLAFLMQLP